MELKKPAYQYYTEATRHVLNTPTSESAQNAISELQELVYANLNRIACEFMKCIVVPFCVKFDYALQVNEGGYSLDPLSSVAPDDAIAEVKDALETKTMLQDFPYLYSFMNSFSTRLSGEATIVETGEKVKIAGFKLFTDHPCPYGWIGGFEVIYDNPAVTGTLRPDEVSFK